MQSAKDRAHRGLEGTVTWNQETSASFHASLARLALSWSETPPPSKWSYDCWLGSCQRACSPLWLCQPLCYTADALVRVWELLGKDVLSFNKRRTQGECFPHFNTFCPMIKPQQDCLPGICPTKGRIQSPGKPPHTVSPNLLEWRSMFNKTHTLSLARGGWWMSFHKDQEALWVTSNARCQ